MGAKSQQRDKPGWKAEEAEAWCHRMVAPTTGTAVTSRGRQAAAEHFPPDLSVSELMLEDAAPLWWRVFPKP